MARRHRERIQSFRDFHDVVQDFADGSTVFRGLENASYRLIPRVGRIRPDAEMMQLYEPEMLAKFKQYAPPMLEREPKNDFEWLAIAQHHGMPTRLLDWTKNPLVALYFAVHTAFEVKDDGLDCVVYMANEFVKIDEEEPGNESPFEVKGNWLISPPHISDRIVAQAGVFTIQPNPCEPMRLESFTKIVIPGAIKKRLAEYLFRYGIHRFSLFPDLDSLGEHLGRQYRYNETIR